MFTRRLMLAGLLLTAGVPQGKELAGYVLAQARDRCPALFSLAAEGKPLSESEGPFRIIVPKDKPGARSLRMLTKLELVQVSK